MLPPGLLHGLLQSWASGLLNHVPCPPSPQVAGPNVRSSLVQARYHSFLVANIARNAKNHHSICVRGTHRRVGHKCRRRSWCDECRCSRVVDLCVALLVCQPSSSLPSSKCHLVGNGVKHHELGHERSLGQLLLPRWMRLLPWLSNLLNHNKLWCSKRNLKGKQINLDLSNKCRAKPNNLVCVACGQTKQQWPRPTKTTMAHMENQ